MLNSLKFSLLFSHYILITQATYYVQNYASIISQGLHWRPRGDQPPMPPPPLDSPLGTLVRVQLVQADQYYRGKSTKIAIKLVSPEKKGLPSKQRNSVAETTLRSMDSEYVVANY